MKLEFKGERTLESASEGRTILELSLENGIPHVHECYGSARCSTCRVRVIAGAENIPAPNGAEGRLAQIKGWPEDVRLACQARPTGDVVLKRLVLDDEDVRIAWSEVSRLRSGVEKEIAVFFLDVEKFTSFTEKHLSYDVIHIMNKFFNRLGDVVLAHDGYIDKFIGDSIMALFGIEEEDPQKACRDAVACAASILAEMNSFNDYLRTNFEHEFAVRIGISAGPVILGSLGHRDRAQYTAIGDAVNSASRIEHANKRAGTRALISSRVYELVREDAQIGRTFRAQLRGKAQEQTLYELQGVNENLRRRAVRAGAASPRVATESQPNLAELPANISAWETDNDHTEVGFEIDYLTTSVRGIFRVHQVDMRFDEERPDETALNAIIKTSSVDTFVAARDNHLRSPDFFDAEQFPNMTFASREVQRRGTDVFVLGGDLTIRDITQRVDLKVRSFPPLADAWGVYKRGFEAETVIDRYDFGITFNLPLNAGGIAIGRQVRIKLILQISRVQSDEQT